MVTSSHLRWSRHLKEWQVFSFFWDLTQEEHLSELEDRVKELEEQMAMAAKWINYLKEQGNVIDAGRTETNT